MSNDIRAALERLVELDKSNITMRSKPAAQAWQLAIAAATTALAQPEREGLRELQCPASVARGCHEAAAEAESGSPLQQLLVAAGDLLAQPEVEGPDHVKLCTMAAELEGIA